MKKLRRTLPGRFRSNRPLVRALVRILIEGQLDWKTLVGPSRKVEIVRPRFAAIYEVRVKTKLSLLAMRPYFGDRDHSSLLNSIRKHKARMGIVD